MCRFHLKNGTQGVFIMVFKFGWRTLRPVADTTPSVLRRHRHRQRRLVLVAACAYRHRQSRRHNSFARIVIGKADDANLSPVSSSSIQTTKILLLLRPRKIQGRQVRTHRIKTNAKSPQDTFPDTARSSPNSFTKIRPGSRLGTLTTMSK